MYGGYSIRKRVLWVVFVMIGATQFYRPNKNIQKSPSTMDFLEIEKPPNKIANLFKKSCYDCHSNFTNYKWFHHIAPLSWFVDNHTKKGKLGLNFSKWGDDTGYEEIIYKRSMRTASIFDIQTGRMPPSDYLRFHQDKKLTAQEKKEMINWLYSLKFDRVNSKVENSK